MAKKSFFEKLFDGASFSAFTLIFDVIKKEISSVVKDTTQTIEKTAKHIGKLFVHYLFIVSILLLGVLFFLISLVLMTQEYFNITLGTSLFIWSIILMVFSLIYSLLIRKED